MVSTGLKFIKPFGLLLCLQHMIKLPVYLDNNATTMCDPRVVEAMLPYFTQHFGNAASRSHQFGWSADAAVELAREQVAMLIGSEPKEIVFTSGATESDNLAIKGIFETYAAKGNHIITLATEHKAVLDTCAHIEKIGGEITYLPVDNNGMVNLALLEAAIRPTTILIAIMYANNETGVVQPMQQIAAIAKKYQILFFSDAVQAVGKIPVNVLSDGIDIMAFTAHKMYGPKGVGALYVRRKNPRVKLTAQIDGGGHERNMRSGTLNVPAIVGFGKAAQIAFKQMAHDGVRLQDLRNRLEKGLLLIEDTQINGNPQLRLPHVTNVAFKRVDSEGLLMGVNKNIALSSGSACTSASIEPSHVLKAMGFSNERAHGSLRFSLGRFTTAEEIDYTLIQIEKAVAKLRDPTPR